MGILFFFQREYFEKAGKYIDIVGDERDALRKNTSNYYLCSAYGANWIQSNIPNIIKWTFKFENPNNTGIIIGVVAKDPDVNKGSIWMNEDLKPSYIWASGGSIWIDGHNKNNYGAKIGQHESNLTMELNLQTKTLQFYIDNKSLGIAVENIETNESIKYKL